ncbi:MAG: transglutaminase domain-containing protein [Candidatus Omnitrophica bacterium]|nr:transglutaminase domain-containing protein [Candidatus Omnitrophota bacterium]
MKVLKKGILFLVTFIVIIAVFNIPVNTKQGINFVVATKKIPFYVKTFGFFYRSYQYGAMSRRLTNGIEGDKEKIAAIFDWTAENVKRKPEGFAIIDDHIWNIVVRRYGTADQMADVFTALASYAGYEAFWISPKISRHLILSFVDIDGRWYMFDLYNKKSFIEGGDLNILTSYGLTYKEALDRIEEKYFETNIRRADKQKFFPRITFEVKKFFVEE